MAWRSAKFSIAVNRKTRRNDQWVDEASFFDCSYFGKGCGSEPVSQQGHAGRDQRPSLLQSRWEQDGQNRSKVEVMVNSLTLLGSPQDGQNQRSAPTASRTGLATSAAPSYGAVADDQIPF